MELQGLGVQGVGFYLQEKVQGLEVWGFRGFGLGFQCSCRSGSADCGSGLAFQALQ